MQATRITTQHPLRLVLSIDVEEEGLFALEYQCQKKPVSNVASLLQLAPLLQGGNLPLTLFCAHAVFDDAAACHTIAQMRDTYGAEVAGHLHHWNTPPVQPEYAGKAVLHGSSAVSTALVPVESMAAKLETLFAAGRLFQGADLTSFRMGRWDLRRDHWPILADLGVKVDASVRPLHAGMPVGFDASVRPLHAGMPVGCDASVRPLHAELGHCPASPPDHFMAPREPYAVQVGPQHIWEVPLTTTPLVWGLPQLTSALYSACHSKFSGAQHAKRGWLSGMATMRATGAGITWGAGALRASVQKWGALTLLPIYQPLWMLKLCTLAHVWAGGRTLSLTWHSSEMMPQGAPHMPTQAAVDAFVHKMSLYVDWLRTTWPVEALTMAELGMCLDEERAALAPCASSATVGTASVPCTSATSGRADPFLPLADWTYAA